jgi:hypothetical protein
MAQARVTAGGEAVGVGPQRIAFPGRRCRGCDGRRSATRGMRVQRTTAGSSGSGWCRCAPLKREKPHRRGRWGFCDPGEGSGFFLIGRDGAKADLICLDRGIPKGAVVTHHPRRSGEGWDGPGNSNPVTGTRATRSARAKTCRIPGDITGDSRPRCGRGRRGQLATTRRKGNTVNSAWKRQHDVAEDACPRCQGSCYVPAPGLGDRMVDECRECEGTGKGVATKKAA